MLKALSSVAVLLAALALAGPAAAQAPVTDTTPAPVCSGTGETDPGTCTSAGDQQIGGGQMLTDPADEIDGPTAPDDGDRPPSGEPKRGEQHVLGGSATASSPPAVRAAPAAAPAAATPAAATSAQPAAPMRPKTLPFTGIDARQLALMGTALILLSWLIRRRLEAGA